MPDAATGHREHPADSSVLVILPVLNEEKNILPLLDSIHHTLADVPHAICIVDDGSTDSTIERIREGMERGRHHIHLIQRRKVVRHSQYGSALKAGREWGLQEAAYKFFAQMDADGSHRAEELKVGLRLLEDDVCDVAIGSKYLPGSHVTGRPPIRYLVSRIANTFSSTLINRKVGDYSNGLRFYTRKAARVLFEHEIKYSSPIYLTEVIAIWLRSGMRVKEFPATYLGRNEGTSKLSMIDMLIAVLAVIEIAFRYHVRGFKRRTPSH